MNTLQSKEIWGSAIRMFFCWLVAEVIVTFFWHNFVTVGPYWARLSLDGITLLTGIVFGMWWIFNYIVQDTNEYQWRRHWNKYGRQHNNTGD